MTCRSLILSLTVLATIVHPTFGQTWTGAASTDWNTASNWSPAVVPNSTTAAATFGNAPLGTNGNIFVNLSSSVSAQSLAFTNTMGNYAIEATSTQTLSNVQSITMAAGVTTVDGIYLSNGSPSTGNLLFPTASNLTITNNCTTQAGELVFEDFIIIGTPGTGGVIVAGPGGTPFLGSFAAAPNNVVGGLTKTGPGTFYYYGSGANLGGNLVLNGGTLDLEYVFSTASKLNNGALYLEGGTLTLGANSSAATTQSIPGGTFIIAGHTDVSSLRTGTVTLAAGAITRSAGATVDFSPSSGALTFNITTSTGNTNGLLGSGPAFATVNGGSSWATASGSAAPFTIAPFTGYGMNSFAFGANTDVTQSATLTPFTTNSLRFAIGNITLTLSGTNTLQSGGILVTPSSGASCTITGGTLTAPSSGELLVHVYDVSGFTINSALVSTVGLTKTGPDTLTLGGSNTGLTGPINVNRGGLTVTVSSAVNSASAINFSDDRYDDPVHTGLTPQVFTVALGNGVNGTISPPIQLSAFSFTDYGTYFSTGASASSTVTLSGVISSAAGLTTPLRLTSNGSDASGFDLTNVNTFMGNISLQHGSLGINSDVSLGNAANTLVLEVNDPVSGGLVFLNGGVTVAHAVLVNQPTRIVCNGTDSNAISSAISGIGAIYKDGTGTLTLTNAANSFNGGVTVSAGTLSLGTTGGLPTGSNVTVAPSATFTALTTTASLQIGTITLNGGTFQATGTGQTIGVNQITTSTQAGTIDFSGTSGDTLNMVGASPAININGNSTWLGPSNATAITNPNSTPVVITVDLGVTLNDGIALNGVGGAFQLGGGGTLVLSSANNSFAAGLTILAGTVQVTGSIQGLVTVNGGATLEYVNKATVSNPVSGAGNVVFSGIDILDTTTILTSTANNYTGPTLIQSATLQLGGPGVIPATSEVILGSGSNPGVLRMAGYDLTIGGLASSGTGPSQVTNYLGVSTNTLTINQSINTTYAGILGGQYGNDANFAVVKQGSGTLTLSGNSDYTGGTTLIGGTVAVGADNNLGNPSGALTFNGGALEGTATFSSARALTIENGGGTINVDLGATLTLSGVISGTGTLFKTGSGTVVLGGNSNSFPILAINGGTVQTPNDNTLGSGPILIGPFGTLNYSGSTTTSRTITMNSGALSVSAGQTLTLNGAAVGGGFLYGPGTFALTGNSALSGVTIQPSAAITQIGPASLFSISNGGPMTISPGVSSALVGFTNQGSGSISIGANSQVTVSDFQSYGLLTIANGTGSTSTLMTNSGTTPLYFNGGSRTFIGTPATAGTYVAGIDLHGQNAEVAGGLFVNNGYVIDSTNGGAAVVADYGALVKGAGFFQNSPVTQNGGRVQAGNSPGSATFGQLTFGPGGVSNYVFAIDDATGTAGPSPNASGQVSGWGLMKSVQRQIGSMTTSGDFAWTADASNKLDVAIETLVNPTTVGTDVGGSMADFDPSRSYSWPAVTWSGGYTGPTDVGALDASTIFDTSGFENPIAGTLGWSFDPAGQTLSVSYTPSAVPEPGTLCLLAVTIGAGWSLRRKLFN